MMNRVSRLTLAVAFSLIAGQVGSAEAQVVPIKGSGTDSLYDPLSGDYWGEGVASHLGRMSFAGNVQAEGVFFPGPGVFFAGSFEGSQVFIAANGDRMDADLSGEVVLTIDPVSGLVSGTWLAQWEITGGTGRFEGVTGALEGAAINPPFDPTVAPWKFDWYFTGEIDLAKRPR